MAHEINSGQNDKRLNADNSNIADILQYQLHAIESALNNEFPAALRDIGIAMELEQSSCINYSCRGLINGQMGKIEEGIKDLSEAIKLEPTSIKRLFSREKLHSLRGQLYAMKGEYDQAIQEYSKAIDMGLSETDTYINRGESYHMAGTAKAKENNHRKALVYFHLAWLDYHKLSRWPSATAELKSYLEEYEKHFPQKTIIKWKKDQLSGSPQSG